MKFRTISLILFSFVIAAYAAVPMPGVEISGETKAALEHIAKDYGRGDLADIMRARKAAKRNTSVNTVQAAALNMSVPLILGTYSNSSARYSNEAFDKQIFTDNPDGTMVEYYQDISYNQFELSGATYGWYSMPQSKNFYAANDGLEGGGARFTFDLVKAADADIDYSQYDSDNDGYVDVVMIVHTGAGAETGADNIWSHRWSLQAARNSYPNIMPQGVYTTNDPRPGFPGQFVKINDYIIQPEQSGSGGLIEIGVFCHEFGHALGLPDLYDTDYSSAGVGRWCLMSGGSYGGDGRHSETPVHMSAWCKAELGWVDPIVINQEEISREIPSSTENGDQVFKLLMNGKDGPEYFLIENRQKTGYDTYLPQGGLLVWHVDENILNSWGPNRDENRKGVDLEAADGRLDLDNNSNRGDSGDPFPGATNNRLFNGSSNPNSQSYLGTDSGVALYIEDVVDGIVTVNFLLTPELVVTPTERVVAYDAGSIDFDIKNLGGGQMDWIATTSDSWLSLANSFGSNQGTLTVNFKENTRSESRTGYVTIAIDNDEQLLSITQSASGEWRALITLTDNGGDNGNLQFGQSFAATSAVDDGLGEVPLPSVPNAGIFDARFILPDNNTASVFDFRAPQQSFVEWRATFQPGAAGMPLTISWDPAVLPKGSFFIQDEITGTLINTNMKETNELVIPTINIQSVKIIYSSQEPERVKTMSGWNLVSVPVQTDDMSLASSFPAATSRAFVFGENGYTATSELNVGQAYWLKFDAENDVPFWGSAVDTTIDLNQGWNLIGPFNEAISVSDISSIPDNIIASDFLAYSNNYLSVEQLKPGKGYWVLAAHDGRLSFNDNFPSAPPLNSGIQPVSQRRAFAMSESDGIDIPLYISDATGKERLLLLGLQPEASSRIDENVLEEELPPMPPAKVFDARFISSDLEGVSLGEGSYIDYRNGNADFVGTVDYHIQLQSTNHARVVIAWELPDNVTGTVTDFLESHIVNKEISGAGELSISMPNIIDRLKFSLNFAAQPSIHITSPNGGEILRVGEESTLTWDSQNIQDDVVVALSRDNGSTFKTLATTGNSGSLAWNVTKPASDECLLRVSSRDGAVLDQSDDTFAIEFPVSVFEDKLPTVFALEQNYPNPFNPATTIQYQLPSSSNVQLVIMNSLGQVIRTLTNGMTAAGSHSVLWDGRNDSGELVSSGLYFYRMSAEDFQQTRKMVFMQ